MQKRDNEPRPLHEAKYHVQKYERAGDLSLILCGVVTALFITLENYGQFESGSEIGSASLLLGILLFMYFHEAAEKKQLTLELQEKYWSSTSSSED